MPLATRKSLPLVGGTIATTFSRAVELLRCSVAFASGTLSRPRLVPFHCRLCHSVPGPRFHVRPSAPYWAVAVHARGLNNHRRSKRKECSFEGDDGVIPTNRSLFLIFVLMCEYPKAYQTVPRHRQVITASAPTATSLFGI